MGEQRGLSVKSLARASILYARGAGTDPYGVFHLRVLEKIGSRHLLVQNIHDAGKKKIRQLEPFKIEADLVYPLVRGRDIGRWRVDPVVYVLIVQDPETRLAIPEWEMKKRWPLTLEYLAQFKSDLRAASSFVTALKERSAFYAMYGIGRKTFMPWRTAWRRMGNIFRASMLLPTHDRFLGRKLMIPSDTTSFVPCNEKNEAMFLCGLINSMPGRATDSFSAAGRGLGAPAVLGRLKIGWFREHNEIDKAVAEAAELVTTTAQRSNADATEIAQAEKDVDAAAAAYWSLSSREIIALAQIVEHSETTAKARRLKDASAGEIATQIAELIG